MVFLKWRFLSIYAHKTVRKKKKKKGPVRAQKGQSCPLQQSHRQHWNHQSSCDDHGRALRVPELNAQLASPGSCAPGLLQLPSPTAALGLSSLCWHFLRALSPPSGYGPEGLSLPCLLVVLLLCAWVWPPGQPSLGSSEMGGLFRGPHLAKHRETGSRPQAAKCPLSARAFKLQNVGSVGEMKTPIMALGGKLPKLHFV